MNIALKNKVLASALIAGLLVVATLFALSIKGEKALGNIASGDAMQSTTTPTVGDGKLLCTGSAVLGSVIITGPKQGAKMQIIDATTTDVVNGNDARAATSTLVIADFPALVAGNASTTGALPFNAIVRTGLMVTSQGNSLSTTTITYRCNQ